MHFGGDKVHRRNVRFTTASKDILADNDVHGADPMRAAKGTTMMKHSIDLRQGAATLSLALGSLALFTATAIQTSVAAQAAEVDMPRETVRQFYDWYLSRLQAGREPWSEDGRMRAYLTAAKIDEGKDLAAQGLDPVLLLPQPRSDWLGMKVNVGKSKIYREAGVEDAYVTVTYRGFKGAPPGTVEVWIVGLSKTPSGWKITSISTDD
jgi:hypothetical protein